MQLVLLELQVLPLTVKRVAPRALVALMLMNMEATEAVVEAAQAILLPAEQAAQQKKHSQVELIAGAVLYGMLAMVVQEVQVALEQHEHLPLMQIYLVAEEMEDMLEAQAAEAAEAA